VRGQTYKKKQARSSNANMCERMYVSRASYVSEGSGLNRLHLF
jgi:hypothetical protein